MSTPDDLRFTESHEWVRDNGDGTADLGITDYAQDQLGDVVFFDAPGVGDAIAKGDEVGDIESVKTASPMYTPVSGEIVAVNEALEDTPELINQDPYKDGWMVRVKLSDAAELSELLDAAAYDAHVASL